MRTGFTQLVNPATEVSSTWRPEVPEAVRKTHREESDLLDRIQAAASQGPSKSEEVCHLAARLVGVLHVRR
jgi:hypothetical protein